MRTDRRRLQGAADENAQATTIQSSSGRCNTSPTAFPLPPPPPPPLSGGQRTFRSLPSHGDGDLGGVNSLTTLSTSGDVTATAVMATVNSTARYSLVVDEIKTFDALSAVATAAVSHTSTTPTNGNHVTNIPAQSSSSASLLHGDIGCDGTLPVTGRNGGAYGGTGGGPTRSGSFGSSSATSRCHSCCLVVCGRTSCSDMLTLVGLVLLPIVTSLVLVTYWTIHAGQMWQLVSERNQLVKQQILNIGQLIVDFNNERELSVMYAVARSVDAQSSLRPFVLRAATDTDRTLADLAYWPPAVDRDDVAPDAASIGSHRDDLSRRLTVSAAIIPPPMLRSPGLLTAVLTRHRTVLFESTGAGSGGGNFWDEIEFYTELIDGLVGWLYGAMKRLRRYDDVAGLWPWLHAYSYLMATTNSLGAEQSLCRAFHSVVCFSRRETLAYANYSYGAEALFRLYRLALAALPPPEDTRRLDQPQQRRTRRHEFDEIDTTEDDEETGDDEWPSSVLGQLSGLQQYSRTFPALIACRREIIDDLDHYGMAIDPSLCDYGRKNETELRETERLTFDERLSLTSRLEAKMAADLEQHRRRYLLSIVALIGVGIYSAVGLFVRCLCACVAVRRNHRCYRHATKTGSHDSDRQTSTELHVAAAAGGGTVIGTVDGDAVSIRHRNSVNSCRRKRGVGSTLDDDIDVADRKWQTSLENWQNEDFFNMGTSTKNGCIPNSSEATSLTVDSHLRNNHHHHHHHHCRPAAVAAAAAVGGGGDCTDQILKSTGSNSSTLNGGIRSELMRNAQDANRTAIKSPAASAASADLPNDAEFASVTVAAAVAASVGVHGAALTSSTSPPGEYCDKHHHHFYVSRH